MKTVTVITAGGANLTSVENALAEAGAFIVLTSDPGVIAKAERVILPGVGTAANSMQSLRKAGLLDVIRALKVPTLGICVGMQLLSDYSEEGDAECLGIVPAQVKKLDFLPDQPIPHMGWNNLSRIIKDCPLLAGVTPDDDFYFVHSYAMAAGHCEMAACDYAGGFSAILQKNNFFGVQFHPEKSAKAGQKILSNFLQC